MALDLSNDDPEDDPQGGDPLAELKRLKAAQDPLDALKASRAQTQPSPTQLRVRQALKSPQGRIRLEQGNREQAEAETPTFTERYIRPLQEATETVAAGVPGAKLAISGYRALETGRPLADVQEEVNQETSDVPYASAIGRAAGSIATPGFKGLSAPKASALLAGADQALSNDQSGVLNRAGRALVGAGAGAAAGKGAEMIGSGVRMGVAKGAEAAKGAAERARAGGLGAWLYDLVKTQPTKALTPEVAQIVQHPDIEPVAARILQLKQFEGKTLADPEVLIEIRKALTDWGHQLDKQGAVLDPGKPNLISQTKEHIRLLKDAFDEAADTQAPGFSTAIKAYAEDSAPLSGQEVGYEAMRRSVNDALPAWKNVGKKTPGVLVPTLRKLPAVAQTEAGTGASEGILGAGREAFGNGRRIKALRKAGPLLRQVDQFAPRAVQRATGISETPAKGFLALLNSLANP